MKFLKKQKTFMSRACMELILCHLTMGKGKLFGDVSSSIIAITPGVLGGRNWERKYQ